MIMNKKVVLSSIKINKLIYYYIYYNNIYNK